LHPGIVRLLLVAVVIVSLDGILLIGAAGPDLDSIRWKFGGLVFVMDVSVVISSILLGILFARRKHRSLSTLFFANLAMFFLAAILRASGFAFHPAVLFAADLYWLHLYLYVLIRHGRAILRPAD